MKLYYPHSRVTARQNFFLCSCCPTMEYIARRSGISQQCQCFYIACKLNHADSRNYVPFGGFVDIALHFGGEMPPPQKKQFLRRE